MEPSRALSALLHIRFPVIRQPARHAPVRQRQVGSVCWALAILFSWVVNGVARTNTLTLQGRRVVAVTSLTLDAHFLGGIEVPSWAA